MQLQTITIEKPEDMNFILGQSHFIKTVEDIHEAIVQAVPQMKFGLGFCEASGPALVRWTGNDPALIDLAKKNAMSLACGHSFILFMTNGFPVNILNIIKNIPEVCRVFCATANQVDVIVAENEWDVYSWRDRRCYCEGDRNRSGYCCAKRLSAKNWL